MRTQLGRLRTRGWLCLLTLAAMLGAMFPAGAAAATGAPATGTLYFTTYQNQGTCSGSGCTTNVWKASWTYDGSGTASGLTIGAPAALATTQGADGITFMPSNGDLLIGGQFSDKVFDVNPSSGAVSAVVYYGVSPQTVSAGVYGAFHLTVGPRGRHLWTSGYGSPAANGGLGGEPGPLQALPLNPLANGTVQQLTGPDQTVTQLAFVTNDPGYAWYTTGNRNGTGNLGVLDVATGATTRICSGEPWAHGITYDPFTRDLLVAGGSEVVQIQPPAGLSGPTLSTLTCSALTPVSTYSAILASPNGEGHFDQITVDGAGHAFAAVNTGYVYFFDYSQTGLIGTGLATNQFLENQLDDVLTTLAPGVCIGGDPDYNGDVNSNNHNGMGEDTGSLQGDSDYNGDVTSNSGTGEDANICQTDPDHNGDIQSNYHNGLGEDTTG